MPRPRIFERPGLPPDIFDLALWPRVDEGALSGAKLDTYRRRKLAIEEYLQYRPIREICSEHRIDRSELTRMANRALGVHDDGRVWGFRALAPWTHVADYSRKTPLPIPQGTVGSGGLSGAFGQLLDQYPQLADYVEREWLGKDRERDEEIALHHRLTLKEMHARFLRKCSSLNISMGEYPFTTDSRAMESLRRYCKLLEALHPVRAAIERDGENAARLLGGGFQESVHVVGKVYRRWTFDAHRIDVLHSITMALPDAGYTTVVCRRNWILLLIDEDSRAVLAAVQTNGRNYCAEDILLLFKKAVFRSGMEILTIPGLSYSARAGWPQEVKGLHWGLPEEVGFDNALANLAKYSVSLMLDLLHCALNPGRAKLPEARSIGERYFGTLEETFGHRLPTTTGHGPGDLRRRDPADAAVRFRVAESDLNELLEVIVANYNGEPHGGNHMYGRSPLDYLEQMVQRGRLPRVLPEEDRTAMRFSTVRQEVVVRGSRTRHQRPHINLWGAVYRSHVLSDNWLLIGERLTLDVDLEDLRTIRAYHRNAELGLLTASGGWGTWKHSLRTRRTILKLIKSKILGSTDDPIIAFEGYLRRLASTGRNADAAADLQRLLTERAELMSRKVPISEQHMPQLGQALSEQGAREWQPDAGEAAGTSEADEITQPKEGPIPPSLPPRRLGRPLFR